jgi:hypothetical protein
MMKARRVLNLLNEVIKDDKDRWRVSVDDHAKTFVVYRGSDDICGGYYDPETKTLKDIEFMDRMYQKNNQTRLKVMDMIQKTFPGYK